MADLNIDQRRIRRGAEAAERSMKWHGEHVPYTVYETLPSLSDNTEETNEK